MYDPTSFFLLAPSVTRFPFLQRAPLITFLNGGCALNPTLCCFIPLVPQFRFLLTERESCQVFRPPSHLLSFLTPSNPLHPPSDELIRFPLSTLLFFHSPIAPDRGLFQPRFAGPLLYISLLFRFAPQSPPLVISPSIFLFTFKNCHDRLPCVQTEARWSPFSFVRSP